MLIKAAFTPGLLGPLLAFFFFALEAAIRGTSGLSSEKAFTSLAIISLLTAPASELLFSIPSFNTALASFLRIQDFLLAQPRQDERIENEVQLTEFESAVDSVGLIDLPSGLLGHETIRVQDAHIQPYKESSFALRSISFKASRGSLSMIIGPVGSGKSTLLKAILGELKYQSGTIQTISRRMAYCSQTPWLPNSTVRNIICGGSEIEIDETFYNTVIHACALEEDLLRLPNGHQTLIGSRGVTLSGGQKQRLVSGI